MSNKILVIATNVNCFEIYSPDTIRKHYHTVNKLLRKPLPLVYCFINSDVVLFRFDKGNGEHVRFRVWKSGIVGAPDFIGSDRRADHRLYPTRYINIQKLPRNYRKSL